MSFTERIEINPRKLGGVPAFRGTRIPVSRLFDYLETGSSVEDFIGEYEIDPERVRRFVRALRGTVASERAIRKEEHLPT